ncbi:relaxase/mobilization nuclease domain-containing protein [Pedobacter sp. V48]|uniref:relaxase/mobilization nuclease domain-containing protein n=1 Tax=Pedobacter sp. V48 TaxID=509635 RepID=UPI0004B74431|nr:relaxase/mobilization nuclease domain-containing protein [Pedobacter sp. V48]
MRGALQYNENKVAEGKAELIVASGFAGDIDQMNFHQKLQRFENLLMLNPKVKTNTLHISLNFHSSEKLKDYKLQQIALTYMDRIGFGDQPFLVYRHNDAGHDHVHIVTTNVQADGERIDLHNIGANQSEKARKEIEIEFDLVKAESNRLKLGPGIGPVDVQKVIYGKVPTKRAVSNTVNAIIGSYQFTSVAELNAVLKQFNVVADLGAEDTLMFQKKGLIYSLLDEKGNKIGVPIKSSSLHSKPTLPFLEKQFVKHAESRLQYKPQLKKSIDKILAAKPRNQEAFIKAMGSAGIHAVFRIGANGQAFGITYVDNWHKTVFNGSDLGKAYGAKAILSNLESNRMSAEALQMSIKNSQKSTSPVDRINASERLNDIATTIPNLLETMLKEQFDSSSRLPRKKKRKKLNI